MAKKVKEEGAKQVMKAITKAESAIVLVVRKKAIKPRRVARSMSPLSRRRQARRESQKVEQKSLNGSLNGGDDEKQPAPASPEKTQQSISTESPGDDVGAADQTSYGEEDLKSNGSTSKKVKSKKTKKKSRSLSKSPTKKKSLSKRSASKVGNSSNSGDNHASLASLKESLSPSTSSGRRMISAQNLSMDSNRSFDYEDFPGDFIKIRVTKHSEEQPGITFELIEGKLFLTAVPEHEKRIEPGMQVLAINGKTNFISAANAHDHIHRAKTDVLLVIDFSKPMVPPGVTCPCCTKPIDVDGKHMPTKSPMSSPLVEKKISTSEASLQLTAPEKLSPIVSTDSLLINGKSIKSSERSSVSSKQQSLSYPTGPRKITYRKLEEKESTGAAAASEIVSVAQSETTTKRNNRTPAGTRRTPRVTRPPKYHFDEFDSDDSEDDNSAEPSPSPAGSRKRMGSGMRKKVERRK
mmetsp:Transcript_71819/g.208073  ORF Transcript_71819/g.208073 Transcript_71819/m.208073 type:complete len:465 (+) Transcript_71819:397-1791(+)